MLYHAKTVCNKMTCVM